MESLLAPRLIVSGIQQNFLSSLLCFGLATELKRRGLSVSAGVIGPALSDASILRRITGRSVRCFDERLLAPGQSLVGVYQSCVGADIFLVHGGCTGLFDGFKVGSLRGSCSDFASAIHTPVVLAIDAQGFGTTIGGVVKGLENVAKGFSILGPVLFREAAPSPIDRDAFEEAVQAFGINSIAGLLQTPDLPQDLPLGRLEQTHNHSSLNRQFLLDVASAIAANVDIDQLLTGASKATPIKITDYQHTPNIKRTRVAVSDDSCFAVSFQDNVEWLRYFGAEIVPFSPLADNRLPANIGGLYMTGAYLAAHAAELASNTSMLTSIRDFHDSGGVLYSEGASSALLCKHYTLSDGRSFEGAGVVQGEATAQPLVTTFCDVLTLEDSILGRSGLMIRAVNTNEWKISKTNRIPAILKSSSAAKSFWLDGYSPGAQSVILTGMVHLGSNPEIAKNLVDASEVVYKLT